MYFDQTVDNQSLYFHGGLQIKAGLKYPRLTVVTFMLLTSREVCLLPLLLYFPQFGLSTGNHFHIFSQLFAYYLQVNDK